MCYVYIHFPNKQNITIKDGDSITSTLDQVTMLIDYFA